MRIIKWEQAAGGDEDERTKDGWEPYGVTKVTRDIDGILTTDPIILYKRPCGYIEVEEKLVKSTVQDKITGAREKKIQLEPVGHETNFNLNKLKYDTYMDASPEEASKQNEIQTRIDNNEFDYEDF